MIDLRLWRAALLAVPVVLVVGMFSLEEVPNALQPALPPDSFDEDASVTLAKDLARSAPAPSPGSDQDEALSETVLSRLKSIPTAEISEQRFGATYQGEDVELRNLIAVLPGQSDRQVALVVHRDAVEGSGAASSAAATAAMLEIASGFTGATHEKTLVFVSSDGGSIGALGARRFARDYSDAALLDAVVVLTRPAAAEPVAPLVIPWATGPQSTSARLAETAEATVSEETGATLGDEGPLDDLLRLAIPAALGEQGPLVESGFDAIRLSSSGELPPPPGGDEPADINPASLGNFGRATLALMLAIDAGPSPPEHGPGAYIGLAGNLLPGWTLSLLALTLLFAVALPAGAALAGVARSPLEAARALGWVALRALPFVSALALVFVLALVGLIPSPDFPFDPAAEALGLGGTIGVALALLMLGATAFLLRPLLPPPPSLAALAPAAAMAVATIAAFGIWTMNPYLALLVGLGLQLWMLAAAGAVGGRLAAAGLVAAGLLPLLAAIGDLSGRFDAGLGVVWDLLFMLTGDQLSFRLALLGCLLAGAALAILAINGPEPAADARQPGLRALIARGRALEERRGARRERSRGRKRRARRKGRGRPGEPEPPPAEPQPADPEAEPESPSGPDPPPAEQEPAQSEPERDPRMWSKPSWSILRPL